jgi:indole-3-glycerol phosphate synthase
MSAAGFLEEMARSSAARVARALAAESAARLEERARAAPAAPPLKLSPLGFDVIAEVKLRSPAAGVLAGDGEVAGRRVEGYARAGACAVSVLTEPSRFDGQLEHLRTAAEILRPLGVPAMRKDFIVDPYQVLEARAAGAGGVLLILRMLSAARLAELNALARELGLFVLLEAFDRDDLERARSCTAGHPAAGAPLLVGLNCRDLDTLEVVPERFAELAPLLPAGVCTVAESGVRGPEDAQRMRAMGYRAALIGTSLMEASDPQALLALILAGARCAPGLGAAAAPGQRGSKT